MFSSLISDPICVVPSLSLYIYIKYVMATHCDRMIGPFSTHHTLNKHISNHTHTLNYILFYDLPHRLLNNNNNNNLKVH